MLKNIIAGVSLALSTALVSLPASAQGYDAVGRIENYYNGVRDIYREAAKLLGAAVGPDQRQPIITLQKVCATSLGQLREALDLSRIRSQNEAFPLVERARLMHSECEKRFAAVKQG